MKYFRFDKENDYLIIICQGKWSMCNTKELEQEMDIVLSKKSNCRDIVINLSNIVEIDTSSAVILYHFIEKLKIKYNIKIIKKDNKQEKFIDFIDKHLKKEKRIIKTFKELNLVQKIGKYFISYIKDFWLFVAFIGKSNIAFAKYFIYPAKIRFKMIVKNIEDAGVTALPIIAITSFLVGVVVAYQSAVQLQKFGANIFIVDMIGISVTRELAPLITAIVVAGRSGSSYTAQIGAQKITRELDAMKTMGFDLFDFLVLPRIIALMIALPLMIFFADIVGIFGGMVVAKYQMNISYIEFLHRLQNVLALKHLWIGLAKGPFFAVLIAGIGCFRGFQVSNNTESIGKYTTISVVNSIFMVIACDAIFSVILTGIGI